MLLDFECKFGLHREVLCCLAWDLDSKVVGAKAVVGWVGISKGKSSISVGGSSVGIGGSGITVGSGVKESISISFSFPLLAAIESIGASIGGITVRGSSAWNWDVGSVDAWGRLEGSGGKTISTVGIGGSSIAIGSSCSVKKAWIGLSLSLGVDGGHNGEKNNLKK